MNTILVITAAVCLIAAAVAVLWNNKNTAKTISRVSDMLDRAIDGSFTESNYDETVMSALESKLWQYLSSSEISARKTAEEKETIKTLIADIAHQTKTPISNMKLYSELLAEQELPMEAAEYAEKIGSQAEKLDFLISSLIKLSRLETGILSLRPKQNPVVPMLEELVIQYAEAAAQKGLTLHLESDAETKKITACFDEKWTAEALGNLMDNAVKYTQKGGVQIALREYEMFVCIEIRDTGIGIAEEEQPKIFGRFYRSEKVAGEAGVGIGLYLAREIIAGQNGYIKVSSAPDNGSVFSVFLSKQLS